MILLVNGEPLRVERVNNMESQKLSLFKESFLPPWVAKINNKRLGLISNWRGVWNKALSDFWCNVKFS